MLLPRPCVSSGHLLVRVTVATSSVPTLSPALRILTLPKAAGPFQGKMGCGERFCSCCVGLCWVLGTRGLIAGTLSDAALSPSYPAPTCLYLHRGAVLPVRIDLITSPLLKPKHICLVIIKSCPPPARSAAQTCRCCKHQCLCRWSDRGCICLGTARLLHREGDKAHPPNAPTSPSLLPAPLCSSHPQVSEVRGQSQRTPAWEVAVQCSKQKDLGWRCGMNFIPKEHPRSLAERQEPVGAATPPAPQPLRGCLTLHTMSQ